MERIVKKTTTEVIATLNFLSREEIINLFVRYMSSESITSKKFAEFLVKAYDVNPKDLGFAETITDFEKVTPQKLYQIIMMNYYDDLRGFDFMGLLEQDFDKDYLHCFAIDVFGKIKNLTPYEVKLILPSNTNLWESDANPLRKMDVHEQIKTFMNLDSFYESEKKVIMKYLYKYVTKQNK